MILFWIVSLFKFASCFVPDYGFGIGGLVAGKYHVDVTRDAMKYVASQYFNEQKNRPSGSKQIPLNGDLFGVFGWSPNRIFQTFYGKSVSARSFAKAITAIQTGVASVDHEKNMKDNPNHHFDAERFHEANEVLIDLRIEVYNAIMSENYEAARNSMGILLHSLQDFYSHSNWIELGNTVVNSNLGIPGQRWGRKAKPFQPTCTNCSRTCVLKICTAYYCPNNLISELKEQNLLTSGYYGGQNDGFVNVPKPATVQKCSHGGLFDSSSDIPSVGGINKDSKVPRISPHYYLHEEAIRLSRQATIDYLNGIRQDVHDDYKFGTFIGLLVGPSLVFLVDPAGNLIDNKEPMERIVGKIMDESRKAGMQPKSYVVVPFNHPEFPPTFKSMDTKETINYINALIAKSRRNFDSSDRQLSNIDLGLKASDYGSKLFVFTNSTPKDIQLLPQVLSQSVHNKQQISLISSLTGQSIRRRKRFVNAESNSDNEETDETGVDSSNVNTVYDELVEKSGGHWLSYSSIVTEVFSDKKLMQDSQRGSPITVLNMKSKERGTKRTSFIIDPSMVSFVVVATCNQQFPHLLVNDPSGREKRDIIKSEHDGDYETSINVPSMTNAEVGQWNVYVLVNCSVSCNWTLIVKGYSTLFHSVNLKLLDAESTHPGLHKIVGRPIVTENVTAVFSLSSETAVLETAQIRDEKGTVLVNDLQLSLMDDTGHFFTFFIVPGVPFLFSVKGKDENGYIFHRADLIVFPTSYFRISRIIPQNATTTNLVPNGYLTLTFNITNLNALLRRSSLYFFALDYHYNQYIHSYGPYSTAVNLYDSFVANVILKAPPTAKPGDIIRIQVTTGVHGTTYDNSLDLNITVFPAFADPVLPVCSIVESIFDNICKTSDILGTDCWTATWNAIMVFSDSGTGLSSVAVDKVGGEVNMTLSNYNYVNLVSTNITATLEGNCCVQRVTLFVYNKIGRYGTCILQQSGTSTIGTDLNEDSWTVAPRNQNENHWTEDSRTNSENEDQWNSRTDDSNENQWNSQTDDINENQWNSRTNDPHEDQWRSRTSVSKQNHGNSGRRNQNKNQWTDSSTTDEYDNQWNSRTNSPDENRWNVRTPDPHEDEWNAGERESNQNQRNSGRRNHNRNQWTEFSSSSDEHENQWNSRTNDPVETQWNSRTRDPYEEQLNSRTKGSNENRRNSGRSNQNRNQWNEDSVTRNPDENQWNSRSRTSNQNHRYSGSRNQNRNQETDDSDTGDQNSRTREPSEDQWNTRTKESNRNRMGSRNQNRNGWTDDSTMDRNENNYNSRNRHNENYWTESTRSYENENSAVDQNENQWPDE